MASSVVTRPEDKASRSQTAKVNDVEILQHAPEQLRASFHEVD